MVVVLSPNFFAFRLFKKGRHAQVIALHFRDNTHDISFKLSNSEQWTTDKGFYSKPSMAKSLVYLGDEPLHNAIFLKMASVQQHRLLR